MRFLPRTLLILCATSILAACGNDEAEKPPYPGIKLGKPYEVYGRWYKPHYDPSYDEIGMASWYGPGFHGKHSANGETFDENELTAAHKTLPLPCIVRVTNLNNGRSAIIKINDRGPFVADRIIDLSRASAKKLGVKGLAKVRVQFLADETRQYAQTHHIKDSIYAGEIPQNEWRKETQAADATPDQIAAFNNAPTIAAANTMQVQDNELPPLQSPATHATSDIFAVVDDAQAATPDTSPPHPYAAAPTTAPLEGGFFVQAGTFSIMHNAEVLKQKIAAVGNVSIKSVAGAKQTLYRVIAGPYDTKENAKKLLSKLASLGISDAKIFFN